MATNLTTLFTNIANAIRAKTGSSAQIVAENFPTAIAGITTDLKLTNTTTLTSTADGKITFPSDPRNHKVTILHTKQNAQLGSDTTTIKFPILYRTTTSVGNSLFGVSLTPNNKVQFSSKSYENVTLELDGLFNSTEYELEYYD